MVVRTRAELAYRQTCRKFLVATEKRRGAFRAWANEKVWGETGLDEAGFALCGPPSVSHVGPAPRLPLPLPLWFWFWHGLECLSVLGHVFASSVNIQNRRLLVSIMSDYGGDEGG